MLPELVTEIPGPRSRGLTEELRAYESRNVTYVSPGFPVFWERAEGVNVWDADGNRFLDLTAAFAVTALGHGPEAVRAAAREQIDTLYHAMGDVHPSPLKVELCRELSRLTFETWTHGAQSGKTILTNSGSEAVEAAIKTALLATGKPGVLGFEGAYHGLGFGALAAGGMDYFKTPFIRQVPPIGTLLPFPTEVSNIAPESYRQRLDETLERGVAGPDGKAVPIGAIVVEPIQGRGGEVVPTDWFHPMLREATDRHGALLIYDEIYTGFFRTGERFAADHWNVMPDIICLGKALTGGFPLAATVGRAHVMDAWPESNGEALHTSTFLGNPLGCRMALAQLKALGESD
ncbi:MAG: aspartate aminotransferase family protein, partial [Verrucomicrobiota bacterium]